MECSDTTQRDPGDEDGNESQSMTMTYDESHGARWYWDDNIGIRGGENQIENARSDKNNTIIHGPVSALGHTEGALAAMCCSVQYLLYLRQP